MVLCSILFGFRVALLFNEIAVFFGADKRPLSGAEDWRADDNLALRNLSAHGFYRIRVMVRRVIADGSGEAGEVTGSGLHTVFYLLGLRLTKEREKDDQKSHNEQPGDIAGKIA